MERVRVATCQLSQWALDFKGNLSRVKESIQQCKDAGARFRTGPELELCGYGCEDHFFEQDTIDHCWDSLFELLSSNLTDSILCEIGMPVLFRSVRYNCRIFCLNKEILLIRPKIDLSGDGNYREFRYFSGWDSTDTHLYDFMLPTQFKSIGSRHGIAKFGIGIIECLNSTIGAEICEELWTMQAPHISMILDGVDIISNGSGSHHELRKLNTRLDLILNATKKGGGIYLYANQIGCDGGRLYYDGSSLIAVNGKISKILPQFSLKEVEIITADIDLISIRTFRAQTTSFMRQSSQHKYRYSRVFANISLSPPSENIRPLSTFLSLDTLHLSSPMEEIAKGPACWLWDYLRRSGASGFFIPLSGGADSAAVAAIVGSMTQLVIKEISSGNQDIVESLEKILNLKSTSSLFPKTSKELCNQILHTCYMGSQNSSLVTQQLAEAISQDIGSFHLMLKIDSVVSSIITLFSAICGNLIPQFLCHGGSEKEDLALQNVQARVRMVLAYLFASLLPWVRQKKGFLLVLSTGNVDEALCGYLTKYDCSSGDINPIGSISKMDLQTFLLWASIHLEYPSLAVVANSKPTAELRPLPLDSSVKLQTDEDDIGMTYEELSSFGKLRQVMRCGPVSMFLHYLNSFTHTNLTIATAAAQKVKHFFKIYSRNRHKMTTLTPSYHGESYSPDDNRFDHRPFLYPNWDTQYEKIDQLLLSVDKN